MTILFWATAGIWRKNICQLWRVLNRRDLNFYVHNTPLRVSNWYGPTNSSAGIKLAAGREILMSLICFWHLRTLSKNRTNERTKEILISIYKLCTNCSIMHNCSSQSSNITCALPVTDADLYGTQAGNWVPQRYKTMPTQFTHRV